MPLFFKPDTKVIIHGIYEQNVQAYMQTMISSGTRVVGCIHPEEGGEWVIGKPVFETTQIGVDATGANTAIIFVPPLDAADAIYEAIDAGIDLIICVTGGIPLLDVVRVREYIRNTSSRLIGPNSPGIAAPGFGNLGIIPEQITSPGGIGIVSRSSSLAYVTSHLLKQADKGQSTIVGIGSGAVLGTNFVDVLRLFEEDANTEAIVLLGSIGGTLENDAAHFIRTHMTKPVISYVAGLHAPMQARNISYPPLQDNETSTAYKRQQLTQAGSRVVKHLDEIAQYV